MIHAFARQILGLDAQLPQKTLDLISALKMTDCHFDARETVYCAGDRVENIYIARSGWFSSGIELRDGGRQLLNFYVPVDIMGLEFMTTHEAPTMLTALCPSQAVMVSRDAFMDVLYTSPRLMTQMVAILGLQDVLLQERICAMSRMNARDKIAYFLLLLRSKVNAKSQKSASIIRFPLTQTDIADALGLTNVTVSRTITELEKAGYLNYSRNIIEFLQPAKLSKEVGFTDRYARFNETVSKRAKEKIAA